MVELVMANAQLGVSNFQSNGIFVTICSPKPFPSSGFSIFRRPVFAVRLYEKNARKNRVFGIIFVNSRTFISAVSKEGSEILEKEFEFKPSFDQYLKVMGTVRLRSDREKQQKSKEENSKHNSRSRGVFRRLFSEGGGKDAQLGEPEGNLNREKASKVENRYESLGNRNRIAEKSEGQRGFEDEYDNRQSNKDEKEKKMMRGETRGGRWSKYTSGVEPQLDVKSKSTMAKNAKDGPRVTGMLEEEVDFKGKSTMTRNAKDGPRVYKSMDNAVERRKFGVRNEDGVVRTTSMRRKPLIEALFLEV